MNDKTGRFDDYLRERDRLVIEDAQRGGPGGQRYQCVRDIEIDILLLKGDRIEIAERLRVANDLLNFEATTEAYFRAVMAGEEETFIPLTPERVAFIEEAIYDTKKMVGWCQSAVDRLRAYLAG